MGLPKDLNLIDNQVNIALVAFFVPYSIFELPSNLILLMNPLHQDSWCFILEGSIGQNRVVRISLNIVVKLFPKKIPCGSYSWI